jgi:hypothetical protein
MEANMTFLSKTLFTLLSLFLCSSSLIRGADIDLSQHERKIYSQNGEDGVLLRIFELVGTTSKSFVEFGVENGDECNTRHLREALGWQGLMMDGRYHNPAINLQQEWITAENIQELFAKYNVPEEFDLLSIDIDFNDFYVWRNVLKKYRPRVAVIEYNATHLPHEDKIVVYNPAQGWDTTNYFGASILSLFKLARHHGYSLVYADNRGVNLFFIRDDVLQKSGASFLHVNDVSKIYKFPGYGIGPNGGHGADPQNRPFATADAILSSDF